MRPKKRMQLRNELKAHAEEHGIELVSCNRLTEATFPIAILAVCQLAHALHASGDSIGTTVDLFTGVTVVAVRRGFEAK